MTFYLNYSWIIDYRQKMYMLMIQIEMGAFYFVWSTPSHMSLITLHPAAWTTHQVPWAAGDLFLGWCANLRWSPGWLFPPPSTANHSGRPEEESLCAANKWSSTHREMKSRMGSVTDGMLPQKKPPSGVQSPVSGLGSWEEEGGWWLDSGGMRHFIASCNVWSLSSLITNVKCWF